MRKFKARKMAHLVHGEGIDNQVSLGRQVQPGEALVVRYPQCTEGFIIVAVEEVDGHIQVAAKQEAYCRSGKHPVVGQHAGVVPHGLYSVEAFHSCCGRR